MGLSINQNIAALNSYRNLSNTQNDLSKSLEKLSSGFRINRAADDAAGLAISEGLRSQIGGLKVAVRNAQDGISVVQTAEGALTETHAILQRMRDLSVQAANAGGLSDDARGNIQSELTQLKSELTRIADTTQFNGAKLLDGTYSDKVFQVGANVGEVITVSIANSMSANGLAVDDVDVSVVGVQGTWVSGAAYTGIAAVAAGGGTATAAETIEINGTTVTLREAAAVGVAVEAVTAEQVVAKINAADTGVVASLDGGKLVLTEKVASGTNIAVTGGPAGAVGTTSVQSGADKAILAIDEAIKTVSTTRADLGAVQNRFDHTVKNLNVAVENLSASESRIRDTDMASEMVQFTRAQILSQAGTAMLAQANQIPQGVLSLLR